MLLAGCSIYHPKPLTEAAVARNLALPSRQELQIDVSKISHPILHPVEVNLRNGVSPEEAATLAVIMNPTLRADRDRRGLATAQVIAAGVLPNPQISYGRDYVIGGNTAGTVTAFGLSGSWEITSLITLLPKMEAARANLRSVDLNVAWSEWQTAQAARLAAYRVIALREQLAAAQQADAALRQNIAALEKAVQLHEKTVLDLSAAQSTSQDAHLTALSIAQELASQRIELNRAMGLPPDTEIEVTGGQLPSLLHPPSEHDLDANLESRRLDMLGLKQGYKSEDATLRADILAQFPKISIGFNRASDTTNVHTLGFGVTVDIPIFDRNQGNIATERATRQKLFDEYSDRVFQARADIAASLSNIDHLNEQIAAGEKVVPALEKLLQTAKLALAQGNTDVISFYQARYDLILRQIEVLKLKQQLVEAGIALEIASGTYLQSLQPIR